MSQPNVKSKPAEGCDSPMAFTIIKREI
jgi:hypothetical protein